MSDGKVNVRAAEDDNQDDDNEGKERERERGCVA